MESQQGSAGPLYIKVWWRRRYEGSDKVLVVNDRGQGSILEVYSRDGLQGSTGVRKFIHGLSKVLVRVWN